MTQETLESNLSMSQTKDQTKKQLLLLFFSFVYFYLSPSPSCHSQPSCFLFLFILFPLVLLSRYDLIWCELKMDQQHCTKLYSVVDQSVYSCCYSMVMICPNMLKVDKHHCIIVKCLQLLLQHGANKVIQLQHCVGVLCNRMNIHHCLFLQMEVIQCSQLLLQYVLICEKVIYVEIYQLVFARIVLKECGKWVWGWGCGWVSTSVLDRWQFWCLDLMNMENYHCSYL